MKQLWGLKETVERFTPLAENFHRNCHLYPYAGGDYCTSLPDTRIDRVGFFLGLMTISALADQAGIFEMLALQAGLWAKGRALRLYIAIFIRGKSEHVIIDSVRAEHIDLLVIRAREGGEEHPHLGPASTGHTTRFVLDYAPCDVLLLRDQ